MGVEEAKQREISWLGFFSFVSWGYENGLYMARCRDKDSVRKVKNLGKGEHTDG